jgi:hypothetical protein
MRIERHPFDPQTPEAFARSVRAAQIREASAAVARAKQLIAAASSPEELIQARQTLAQASRWLCRLNLET